MKWNDLWHAKARTGRARTQQAREEGREDGGGVGRAERKLQPGRKIETDGEIETDSSALRRSLQGLTSEVFPNLLEQRLALSPFLRSWCSISVSVRTRPTFTGQKSEGVSARLHIFTGMLEVKFKSRHRSGGEGPQRPRQKNESVCVCVALDEAVAYLQAEQSTLITSTWKLFKQDIMLCNTQTHTHTWGGQRQREGLERVSQIQTSSVSCKFLSYVIMH